jgi:hypothetical protein
MLFREASGALCGAKARRALLFDCAAERLVWQHDAANDRPLFSAVYTDLVGQRWALGMSVVKLVWLENKPFLSIQ